MVDKVDRVTVCLLGATKSGKSSLLGSWTKCLNDGYHGFDREISVQAVDEQEFNAHDDEPSHLLGPRGGRFRRLRDGLKKVDGVIATSLDDTYEFFFRIDVRQKPEDGGGSRTVLLQVVDAAGEHWAPTGDSAAEERHPVLEKLENHIRQSEAIILVVPLDFESHDWVEPFAGTLQRLVAQPGMLQRVVVAFTQYERLFVSFGASAFQFAVRHHVEKLVIRRMLDRAPWLNLLRRFEAGERTDKDKVTLAVTSTYGFVKGHGNPNLYLSGKQPERFRSGPAGDDIDQDLWRPFLTADPFIFAALGQHTNFTLPFRLIDQQGPAAPRDGRGGKGEDNPPPSSPPPSGPPPGPKLGNGGADNSDSGLTDILGQWWRKTTRYLDES